MSDHDQACQDRKVKQYRKQWSEHPYGTGMITQHYVYVPIPKCASSWMKSTFHWERFVNFETQDQDVPHDAEFLVVLRDPIDRWISGLAQFHRGSRLKWHKHYRNLGWDRVLSRVIFDNHTEHQTSFLQNIDHRRVTWFKFGPDLARDFFDWGQGKSVQGPEISPVNCSAEHIANIPGETLSAGEMIEEIQAAIEANVGYQQRLREFYCEDYKLYESVPFYRAG